MNVNVDFNVTESAVTQIKKAMEGVVPEGGMLRVFAKGGGCSGMSYSLAFVESDDFNASSDAKQDFEGVTVVVDKKGLFLLDGTTLDWDETASGFKFNAPSKSCCKKEKGDCCG